MKFYQQKSIYLAVMLAVQALTAVAEEPKSADAEVTKINNPVTETDKVDTLPEVKVNAEIIRNGYVATQSAVGTKTNTPLIEVPQSVSIITRDQLDAQNSQTIVQAMRYTAGVIAGPSQYQDSFDTFYLRGFTDFGGSMFLDGLRQLNGEFGVIRMEPYFLQSIEILKGPASVLYGQAMPGGVVNLVSKRPTAEPLHEVGVQYGSHDWREGTFDLGGSLSEDDSLLYRLTGFARDTNNQVDFVESERFSIAPALTWHISDDTNITFLSNFQHDPKAEVPGFVPSSGTVRSNPNGNLDADFFGGDPDFNKFERTQSAVGYLFDHKLDDKWTVRQNLRYTDVQQEQDYLYAAGLEADQRTFDRYSYADVEHTRGFTLDNQLEAKFNNGELQQTLLFGLDYQRQLHDQNTGFGNAPSIDMFDPVYHQPVATPVVGYSVDSTVSQTGLYVQDQLKLDKWVLMLGGRQDWARSTDKDRLAGVNTSQDDQDLTGRAGLVYLFDNGFAPYASFATSFVPQSGTTFGGVAFEPTTGRQYEVGLKYQPKEYNAFITLAAFHLTEENEVVNDPNHPNFSIQLGETRSQGVELEGHATLDNGLSLILAYTYLDAVVTESTNTDVTINGNILPIQGKHITSVPHNALSLWGDYTIHGGDFRGLGFGGGVRYLGETYGDSTNSFKVPSYTVFDAALYYNPADLDSTLKGWRFAVNANNVFNKEYISGCDGADFCNFGELRSVIASASYRW